MTKINDGGSAFPVPLPAQCGGLSVRDYFAGQALIGLIAHPGKTVSVAVGQRPSQVLSRIAYEYADDMIAERDKDQ